MQDQFKRILDLVRKTGDTMVVTDPNGKDVYVVMDLEHYESMVEEMTGGNEEEGDCGDNCCQRIPMQTNLTQIVPTKKEEEWQIPDEFIIDDPEGGLADEVETGGGQGMPNDLDIWSTMQSANESGPTWNVSQMDGSEVAELERQYKEFAQKNVQQAINEGNPGIQTIEAKEPIEEFSEEQFYLEPIE